LTKPASVAGFVVLGIGCQIGCLRSWATRIQIQQRRLPFSEIPLPLMWKPIAENVFCIEYSDNDHNII